jgi:hypothetical protein
MIRDLSWRGRPGTLRMGVMQEPRRRRFRLLHALGRIPCESLLIHGRLAHPEPWPSPVARQRTSLTAVCQRGS